MTIEIFLEPGKVYTWAEFVKQKPNYSIALDGIVSGSTKRKLKGPYVNFDHHKFVDRTSTRCTSEQVHIEINLGLFKTFRKDGLPNANVFINDIDEDVCLAVWLLKNFERVEGHAEPLINKLVYIEDRLDATAGAYPFGLVAIRRQMAWMFEPYQQARFDGRLRSASIGEMKLIVENVGNRITDYTLGKAQEIPLLGNFERLGGGENWTLLKETGPAARIAMYEAGIDAFISYLGPRKTEGMHDYVIGKRSVWIPFPIKKLIQALNAADKSISKENEWGGSNTIGGSPRATGSSLTPAEVEDIVNKTIGAKDV